MKFQKSHEWVKLDGDIATIGISDHAQNELTALCFVELPQVGQQLKRGEACCVVESVKTASDVYCPLTGEVIEINEAVMDSPELVNEAAEGEGWLFKIAPTNLQEINELLSLDDYLGIVS